MTEVADREKLTAEMTQLQADIAEEVNKRAEYKKDCDELSALVSKVMKNKSVEGITLPNLSDLEDDAPRRRQDQAAAPAAPAAAPVKTEPAGAVELRTKLRAAKSKDEFKACMDEANKLGLNHEASMAKRQFDKL